MSPRDSRSPGRVCVRGSHPGRPRRSQLRSPPHPTLQDKARPPCPAFCPPPGREGVDGQEGRFPLQRRVAGPPSWELGLGKRTGLFGPGFLLFLFRVSFQLSLFRNMTPVPPTLGEDRKSRCLPCLLFLSVLFVFPNCRASASVDPWGESFQGKPAPQGNWISAGEPGLLLPRPPSLAAVGSCLWGLASQHERGVTAGLPPPGRPTEAATRSWGGCFGRWDPPGD